MKIYLIRHGESKANVEKLFVGNGDVPLTERGLEQARRTAHALKDIKVDAIYSSDLDRAYQTAMQTATLLNMPIIKDAGLREINLGKYEFIPHETMRTDYSEKWNEWLDDFANACFEGGESVAQVYERVFKTIKKIAEQNLEKTVFIFSHATSIRCFVSYCMGKGVEGANDISWVNNASITQIDYKNGKFEIVEYGRDDFLGDLKVNEISKG